MLNPTIIFVTPPIPSVIPPIPSVIPPIPSVIPAIFSVIPAIFSVIPAKAGTHGLKRLVLIEQFEDVLDAITREKRLKKWNRSWKVELIERGNPEWRDLWFDLNR